MIAKLTLEYNRKGTNMKEQQGLKRCFSAIREALITLILALSLLCSGRAMAQEPPKEAPKQEAAKAATPTPPKEEKKDEAKPFDEVVKGFTVIEGFFTLYQKDEDAKVYMELKPDQFDKIFLCCITRQAGDGRFFDAGAMLGDFPFVFKRVGKTVQFINKNVSFRADKDAPINRAIERGLSDSIMGSAKIESAPHPERRSVLVDPSGFFLQDMEFVSYMLNEYMKAEYGFDRDNSYFGVLKSFPQNTEVETILHFKTAKPRPMFITIPDNRSFLIRYHYSLASLPETDYKPRIADDRVGHFLTMYQDYTSMLRETPYNRYVTRWHLEKAEPKFELSPPKKPIVFWLENTIPAEYREAIKEGILLWNKAFERIGFKDAIVVQQQPDDADWDPADSRYNTIRWIVSPGGGYAVGPSRANPFTGQIYDADVRISADYVRYIFGEYEELANPVAMWDSSASPLHKDCSHGYCDYWVGMAQQAAFGWSLLTARGAVERGEINVEQYLHDALVELAAHEVGHTLGLRHNFKGSTALTNEQLQDVKLTAEEGISGSIMDYVPVNIAPEGKKQGQYYQTTLGPYDYWAIEYAYKPIDADSPDSEKAVLDKIASKVADPKLTYGTDEDAFWGARGIDPDCNRYDLGTDPIAYYRDQIAISKELWSKMEDKFEKKGERYQKLRRVFGYGLNPYYQASEYVTKYIGGIYHRRDHVGDPNGRIPFEVVSAERQREALEFLKKNIFGPDAFSFPPELLNKLAPERFWDFEGSIWSMWRLDYPIHSVILSIQTSPLNRLYDATLLNRMLDNQLRFQKGEKPFTMAEMFEGIRGAIWSELNTQTDVNSFRRALQRAHLNKLIGLVVKPGGGVPEDASTLARADLIELKDKIDNALSNKKLDAYTQAHLDETRSRIEAALKAGIQRQF